MSDLGDLPVMSSETKILRPHFGWYLLQARSDNDDVEPDLDGGHLDNPLAYADDTGGIWLRSTTEYMPVEVTLEVLPVGTRPVIREGAQVVYDGQYYVEKVDQDVGNETGVVTSPQGMEGDPIIWTTRLDWGLWRAVIQVNGYGKSGEAQRIWQEADGDKEQSVAEYWWVSLLDIV
jgi:hypothetical protein